MIAVNDWNAQQQLKIEMIRDAKFSRWLKCSAANERKGEKNDIAMAKIFSNASVNGWNARQRLS